MQNRLFKKSSVERFSSPEKLNDYIQVNGVGSWMLLTAALALVLGMLIWGFFGEITQSESFSGVAKEGALECYVSSAIAADLQPEMEVRLAPMTSADDAEIITGTVVSIADYPLSYEEASVGIDSDYLLAAMGISAWNFPVQIQPAEQLHDGMIYAVTAVTDSLRPIDMVFR